MIMKNTKNANLNQLVAQSQEDYYEYMESVHGAFSNPKNKPRHHEIAITEAQPLSSTFVTTASHKTPKSTLHPKRHAHATARVR